MEHARRVGGDRSTVFHHKSQDQGAGLGEKDRRQVRVDEITPKRQSPFWAEKSGAGALLLNLNKPEGRRAFLPDSALREAAPSSRSVSLSLELLEHSLLVDGPQRTFEKPAPGIAGGLIHLLDELVGAECLSGVVVGELTAPPLTKRCSFVLGLSVGHSWRRSRPYSGIQRRYSCPLVPQHL